MTTVDRGRTTTQNKNCKRVYGSAAGKSLESVYLWFEKSENYLQDINIWGQLKNSGGLPLIESL